VSHAKALRRKGRKKEKGIWNRRQQRRDSREL
jgi:hypothetical protein